MKLNIEHIALLIFATIFLLFGIGNLFGQTITNDVPQGYLASDAFQHQTRTEGLIDQGNYRYEAPYNVLGLEDVTGFYMPLFYHLAAMFSLGLDVESYDGAFIFLFFLTLLGVLISYFTIKKLNTKVALLSLPLTFLVFGNGTYIAYTWGHWPAVASMVFLLAFFWTFCYEKEKWFPYIAGIFLAASFMTHSVSGIIGVIFLLSWVGLKYLRKEFNKQVIKQAIVMGCLSFVICLYYLPIFKAAWVDTQVNQYGGIQQIWEGTPGFYMEYFGLLLIPMVLGLGSVYFFYKKQNYHALLAAVVMLLVGYFNYLGWGRRAFAVRFFWPIFLAVFLGLGIYMAVKLAKQKLTMPITLVVIAVLTILIGGLVAIPGIPTYQKVQASMVDQGHWDAITFLRDQTEVNSEVYFLYGDLYTQDAVIRNIKRKHYIVITGDYLEAAQNGTVKRIYETELPGDRGGGLVKKESWLSYTDRRGQPNTVNGPRDLCDMDYIVVDKSSRTPLLAQYNVVIANIMGSSPAVSLAYQNDRVAILHNDKSSPCLPEGGVSLDRA